MKAHLQQRSASIPILVAICLLIVKPTFGSDLIVAQISAENPETSLLYRGPSGLADEPVTVYSARIVLCNTDDGNVPVLIDSAMHPMFVQNLYRAKNGRFQQIGMSWVRHLGVTTNQSLCGPGDCEALPGTFDQLCPDCGTDVYGSFMAVQFRMGPRFEINPVTEIGPQPFTGHGETGPTPISKLMQVRNSDLDPALNPGARYFIETQVLSNADRMSGSQINNVSAREVLVQQSSADVFDLQVTGPTLVGEPAIKLWASTDPLVTCEPNDIANDGRLYLASRAAQITPTRWQYNWAIYNQDSRKSVSGLSVPLSSALLVQSTGFYDVDYHSGDGNVLGTNFSGVDWPAAIAPDSIRWHTDDFATDPNANAIRWGTAYSFELVTNAAPAAQSIELELYRDSTRGITVAPGVGPGVPGTGACCMSNGACEVGSEISCQQSGAVYQGDGVDCTQASCAQPGDTQLSLETTTSCPGDSNGPDEGDTFEVELWMRNMPSVVTGFQAFILFDPALLDFRPDLSSYSSSPFSSHLVHMPDAEVAPGLINLDGSSGFGGMGTSADTRLATIIFQVRDGADCQTTRVQFRQNLPFASEVSNGGQPLSTVLVPTSDLTFDDVSPQIEASALADCYPDLASAEAAAVAATVATDNCTDAMSLDYHVDVSGDPCSTTLTVTVMDACGNMAETSYAARIDGTSPTPIGTVDDISTVAPSGTCEAVVSYSAPSFSDNCTATPDVVCVPPSGSVFPAGTTRVVCTAQDECGNATDVSFNVSVDAVRDRLELRIQDPVDCYEAGDRICVDLVMTCLDQPVTGFNAFIQYDADLVDFVPAASSYTNDPFSVHIVSPPTASVMSGTGVINLDGSIMPEGAASDEDAVLATLCFDVRPNMGGQSYPFEFAVPPSPTFGNELSVDGSPVPTVLASDTTETPMPRLRLVTTTPRECYQANDLVCVELQMVCLGDQTVTGFNAFLEFDPNVLSFESGAYTNTPFPTHLTPIDAVAGHLTLDGSVMPPSPGTNQNAVLATLCFRIQKFAPGTPTSIDFNPAPTPSIHSELSVNGVPVPTILESADILTQSTMGLRVCYRSGEPVCVLLEATCLDGPVSGYTAEVTYDNDVLEFLPGDSGYESTPFSLHMADPITPMISGSSASVSMDGQLPPMSPLVVDDTVLASLCFDIRPGFEGVGATVQFQPAMPGLESRLLVGPNPVATYLRDSPIFGLRGDINLDGVVDLTDISTFTQVLLNLDIDQDRRSRSDLNCDSRADGLDTQEFVNLLVP